MKNVFSPNISLYSELLPYLQDFFVLNKSRNPKFSYRFLAMKLQWSAPYLNDVIKGRKKLSLPRALEFIQYVGLKGAKAERFLFLYLSDSSTDFSQSFLKKSALESTNTLKEHQRAMDFEEFEKMQTLLDYYILYFIELNKGAWSVETFLSQLTLSIKPSKQLTEMVFNRLIKNNFLKCNSDKSIYEICINDQLIFDQSAISETEIQKRRLEALVSQEKEYVLNYQNYLSNPFFPNKRTFCSGIINLDMELFSEAVDRIYALRNYLYELDVKGQARYAEAQGPESRVWQFSINLFSLFENHETSLDKSSN